MKREIPQRESKGFAPVPKGEKEESGLIKTRGGQTFFQPHICKNLIFRPHVQKKRFPRGAGKGDGKMVRGDWLDLMLKIADPVLRNLAEGKLHEVLPVEKSSREPYACLEAFGRTIAGLAPWLELENLQGEEGAKQQEYRALALVCIDKAIDPSSPDLMNFSEGYGQSLVDAAYLANALLRAPNALLSSLSPRVKRNLADCLISTRKFIPCSTNWLFFSAIVEAALFKMGEAWQVYPVERAIDSFEKWYKGDGMYGDGQYFHMDYYNSYAIHPMYVDVLQTFAPVSPRCSDLLPAVLRRARRYAAIQERLISPEGTYPATGRSLCYRFGAFQALGQAALYHNLPAEISPAQVRCALSAVIERTVKGGMFDEKGFLKTGLIGSQPALGEGYICVGSLYMCEAVFLPLGLSPNDPFWASPDEDWTNKKIWAGENVPCDEAVDV